MRAWHKNTCPVYLLRCTVYTWYIQDSLSLCGEIVAIDFAMHFLAICICWSVKVATKILLDTGPFSGATEWCELQNQY